LIKFVIAIVEFAAYEMFSTIRDPFRGVVDEFLTADVDPWLSSNVGYWPTQNVGGRTQRRSIGKLMTIDAFETDQEFKIMCEVPGVPKERLDVNIDNYLLTIKCTKQQP
jgi:HSP20 family molecular chaperone IbpA